ncbi:hypothetical protein B5X24_HaOG205077 [Helicoverpa armigera]|nr:hypothetical protein B5X24_HaOG205077 [Helicoverpa armigera]
MNKHEGIAFLFTITREIQQSFVSPVILFTHNDYAKSIFTTYTSIHQALLDKAPAENIAEIISSCHLKWLEDVLEIEQFKSRIKETPRDDILKAVDFTIECTRQRYSDLKQYITKFNSVISFEESQLMQSDLTIARDMKEVVVTALIEKQHYISSQTDENEYHLRINDEVEELLHWLDKLNDDLGADFCKVLNFNVPLSANDLTKTLKDIIDEVAADPSPEAQKVAELIHIKGRVLTSAIRLSSINELEISKIIEKIKGLETRINRLKGQHSSALMALKHKTTFLEERLQSLENIKSAMRNYGDPDALESTISNKDDRIFNHLLPPRDRCRLVEKLIHLWNSAIVEHDHESIISILSVADFKEVFSDEKGIFTVDKYGRKIYTGVKEGVLYQLNENEILVPLKDDEKHVYFYDSCGRYYINDRRERIYKDHDGASEYMLSKFGYLVKVQEEKDGIEYFYDWLGRYYITEEGRHIYCEENSTEEYEHDGLGNLVKIHTETFHYESCPTQPMTMEENIYLKHMVGEALKKCIAEVVIHQPHDPVAYLADRLTKYSDNIKAHEKHLKDEQERFEQSQLIHVSKESSVNCSYADYETVDENFRTYEHETDASSTSY